MNSARAFKLARTIQRMNDEARREGKAVIGRPGALRVTEGSKDLAATPSKPAQNAFKFVR